MGILPLLLLSLVTWNLLVLQTWYGYRRRLWVPRTPWYKVSIFENAGSGFCKSGNILAVHFMTGGIHMLIYWYQGRTSVIKVSGHAHSEGLTQG